MGTGSFLITYSNGHNKAAITEMYPRIPWELVADPLGYAEHTLGTTVLDQWYSTWGTRRHFRGCVKLKKIYILFHDKH